MPKALAGWQLVGEFLPLPTILDSRISFHPELELLMEDLETLAMTSPE